MELPFGIRRITTPLPTRPGHVHSYLLPPEKTAFRMTGGCSCWAWGWWQ